MPFDTDGLPRFACLDWWERLQRGETPMADVPLDDERAARAVAFFNRLRLPDVPGNPRLAEACGEWFRDILRAFLASADPVTRERLVWEVLCMVPKKSSKTTYTAALALTALYMEEAPNRQMLLIGPSQNISERCFDQAQGMIRLDEKLTRVFRVQDHLKTITRFKTGTKLEVMTFDASIVTGEIPVLTIIDEVHELGKKSAAQSVMQQIRGGGITMQGGQVMMITTQSDAEPAGVWKTELTKARAIRDGKGGSSPIMLPVLYEFPPEQQVDGKFWRDRRNWKLVLPNLGLSISRQRLEDDYENNGKVTPEAERIWVSQHLNVEVGLGIKGDAWSGAAHWMGCAAPGGLTLAQVLDESEVCTIGVDWGGQDDLASLVVLGRSKRDKAWLHWSRSWARPSVFEQRKAIAPRLQDFVAAGELVIVETGEEQAAEAADTAWQVYDAHLLPEKAGIGLDSAGVALLLDALEERELVQPLVAAVTQGWKLTQAVSTMGLKLEGRRVRHAGQGIMAWSVGNAKQELRGNNYMVTKQASGAAKIDPVMATFNAAMLMFLNPVAAVRRDIGEFLANPIVAMGRG
jgi:phage terminase large subunit-like protein